MYINIYNQIFTAIPMHISIKYRIYNSLIFNCINIIFIKLIFSIEPPVCWPEKTVSQPGRELKLNMNMALAFRIKPMPFNRNSKFQKSVETSFFLDSFLSFLIKQKRKIYIKSINIEKNKN
jgi:hypothetical protein